MSELAHLGQQSQSAIERLDCIPWTSGPLTVTLCCTEFTSHCPVTKQPDFGQLEIVYEPDASLVETKSLKLWLWRYRDRAAFNEAIVAELCAAFMEQVKPKRVTISGTFNPRGGISVRAEATLSR